MVRKNKRKNVKKVEKLKGVVEVKIDLNDMMPSMFEDFIVDEFGGEEEDYY